MSASRVVKQHEGDAEAGFTLALSIDVEQVSRMRSARPWRSLGQTSTIAVRTALFLKGTRSLMSDVKIPEDVVKQLRLKELYRTTAERVMTLQINAKSEVELTDFDNSFPVAVPAQLGSDCRFFAFLDLMTYKLKVVLWVGPKAPQTTRALYTSCGGEVASIGSFPLVTVSTLEELSAAFNYKARDDAYKSIAKPVIRVSREELLEYQPAWNAGTYPHRRFANLFWIRLPEGNTFKLIRCRSDQAFQTGTGQPTSLAEARNEALNVLADDVDVSKIFMYPEAGGTAPEPLLTDAEKYRVWNDPSGGGARTEVSHDEKSKINGRAKLTLERSDSDKDNWSLTCTIGADVFWWLVFWFYSGHSYHAKCTIYRQDDWNAARLSNPVASASTSGSGGASRTVTLKLDRPIGVNTGRYVWVWSYSRLEQEVATLGVNNVNEVMRSGAVTINGNIVIDSGV
jgi:hypothetical protein